MLAVFLVNGLLAISALPQQQGANPGADAYSQNSGQVPQSASFGASSTSISQQQSSSGGGLGDQTGGSNTFGGQGGQSGGSGGSQGGNLNVQCKNQETAPGKFKFVCDGVDKNAISLKSEHVLWLTNSGGKQQIVDIEIPNYKIEELIKAGFKTLPGQGSLINLLLKKPEQTYDAQVDKLPEAGGTPTVNLQYEAGSKVLVHYPNDKPYSPLQGPILPPLAGTGASGGRPQRQAYIPVLRGQRVNRVQGAN